MWKSKSLSHVWLFEILWTVAHQAPLSMRILQARILEWVAILFSRESSWPREWTWVPCIAGRFFTVWATREALIGRLYANKAVNKEKNQNFKDLSYPILAEGALNSPLTLRKFRNRRKGEKPVPTARVKIWPSWKQPHDPLMRIPTSAQRYPRVAQYILQKLTCSCFTPGRWAVSFSGATGHTHLSDTASACSSLRSISRISSSVYSSFTRSSASSLSTACSCAVVLASSTVTASCRTKGMTLRSNWGQWCVVVKRKACGSTLLPYPAGSCPVAIPGCPPVRSTSALVDRKSVTWPF